MTSSWSLVVQTFRPARPARAVEEVLANSNAVSDVTEFLLSRGCYLRFRASGRSMQPTIRDGEILMLAPIRPTELRKGDIVLSRQGDRLVAHRVVKLWTGRGRHAGPPLRSDNGGQAGVLLRGDASASCDLPIGPDAILAKVVAVERGGQWIELGTRRARMRFFGRRLARFARHSAAGIVRSTISLARNWCGVSYKSTSSHPNALPLIAAHHRNSLVLQHLRHRERLGRDIAEA